MCQGSSKTEAGLRGVGGGGWDTVADLLPAQAGEEARARMKAEGTQKTHAEKYL